MMMWMLKFHTKHLHHPSTLIVSTIKYHLPQNPTSLQKTLQGYSFLWPFSLRMLTIFKGDLTQHSNLQLIGCNSHWTLRRTLSHAFLSYIRKLKLHPPLMKWINLQGLKSFLHQLGRAFTLRYPSLHPQRPCTKVFTRFYLGLVEKWSTTTKTLLDGATRLMHNILTHILIIFCYHFYVQSTSNSSFSCPSSFLQSMTIKPFF